MSRKDELTINDLLPLAPALFHMLLILSEGERHGYALKREIARRTGGKINPGPGVLYGSINKMLEQGLIEESDERPASHLDDERRRYYRITRLGGEWRRPKPCACGNWLRSRRQTSVFRNLYETIPVSVEILSGALPGRVRKAARTAISG